MTLKIVTDPAGALCVWDSFTSTWLMRGGNEPEVQDAYAKAARREAAEKVHRDLIEFRRAQKIRQKFGRGLGPFEDCVAVTELLHGTDGVGHGPIT